MTDPTSRTPTLPRKVVPPARPPLVGITPSQPPGSRRSNGGQFWKRVVTRRIRNTTEMIRRGLAGPRRPPENIPVVSLSDEENVPPNATVSSSARAAGPTIKLIEVFPRHTFRLIRPPDDGGSSAISAAGAAAPAAPPVKGIAGTTTAPTAPPLTPATEGPITAAVPHAVATPATPGPGITQEPTPLPQVGVEQCRGCPATRSTSPAPHHGRKKTSWSTGA
ncbi:PREDICTED: formin-like protein 16 [Vollenhovia emeryi]|uniref:formin-like protein 16 n=1 Tax=Vollenhovia emeryi TaxID=411798 RepID=UPI0005F4845B|nr:PREDICTED: formin-like protein 16 [Vollenhovia emeryi]